MKKKADWKLNFQKTKDHGIWSHNFMANRWGNKAVRAFISLCSKITADVDCIHEFKRLLLLGRKAMTNLESILKSRDITLMTWPAMRSNQSILKKINPEYSLEGLKLKLQYFGYLI